MRCTKCLQTVGFWPNIPGNVCNNCLPSWWQKLQNQLNRYQALIQQRKTTIQQELTLLRNLLNNHD